MAKKRHKHVQVFVFASGAGTRWADADPPFKQLAEDPITKKPVIVRMVERFAPKHPVAVVTPHAEIVGALSKHLSKEIKANSLTIMEVGTPPLMTETLRLTKSDWDDRNLALLGDVWFSERAFKAMEYGLENGGLRFYGRREKSFLTGNEGETFSFQWEHEHAGRLVEAIDAAKGHWEACGFGNYDRIGTPHGCPWQLYRHMHGIPLDVHTTEAGWVDINDFTDDFDSHQQYKQWKARFRRRLICEKPIQKIGNFDDWRPCAQLKPMEYIVLSTGHSATGYMAKLLTSAGVPCGHEGVFRATVVQNPTVRADSSFYAVAHLDHPLAEGAKLVHLVRHPLKVIRSWKHGGTLRANDLWTAHILQKNGVTWDPHDKSLENLALRYVLWNRLIEEKAPGATRVRAEDRKGILADLGHPLGQKYHCHGSFEATQRHGEAVGKLYDNAEYNAKPKAKDAPELTWDDLGAAADAVREMALEYGYA